MHYSQCHVVLSNGKVHSLVFAGQFDGDVILLHSTKGALSMRSSCPAHDSRVTSLVGAYDLLTTTSTSNKSIVTESALISYGKISDRLHVWAIQIQEERFTVSLQLLMVVKLTVQPCFIALMNNTVCLVLDDGQVLMFKSQSKKRQISTHVENLAGINLMKDQPEDRHAKEVTSLNACPYLQIFVTSSKDGFIKVWSSENQLMSEINFGVPVSSVGFANNQGDLLVGLQQHISITPAENYLPDYYAEISRSCTNWDYKEQPIPFDPNLEFW